MFSASSTTFLSLPMISNSAGSLPVLVTTKRTWPAPAVRVAGAHPAGLTEMAIDAPSPLPALGVAPPHPTASVAMARLARTERKSEGTMGDSDGRGTRGATAIGWP